MHNNYYFLKQLTTTLDQKLTGHKLVECFSQNKNELIIIFDGFIIKGHLNPSFCCLAFPDDFHRARKNSVNLFDEIIDRKVRSVTQYLNERCFSIDFEADYQLLFKMHGNRSNIILMVNGKAKDLFVNRLAKDTLLEIGQLDRQLDQSFAAFQSNDGDYKKLFPTFGKEVQQFIDDRGYQNKSIEGKWELLEKTLIQLESGDYYVESDNGLIELKLFRIRSDSDHFRNSIEAINYFFNHYISETTLSRERQVVTQKLSQVLKRLERYIS
ncbi:MAG: hypothetical protein AAFN93_03985, partial [Bacteroidota bacterium]